MKHFSHPDHPLIEDQSAGRCSGCRSYFRNFTLSYRCEECQFYLHQCCAELKEEIQHLGHPQHPLFLTHNTQEFVCKGCESDREGFSYHCSECSFDLDLECALQNLDPCPSITFHHKGHQLVYSNQPTVDDWNCVICNELLDIPVFKCKDHDCKHRMHLHCAPLKFPEKIHHRRHRYGKHPLVFCKRFREDDSGEYYCDSCEQRRNPDDPVYCCNQCQEPYIAHMACALSNDEVFRTLAEAHESSTKDNNLVHHEHPLILRVANKEALLKNRCIVCDLAPDSWSLILTCEQCDFCLHEHCSRLEMEIQHPCHSKHSLTLLANAIDKGPLFRCNACNERRSQYIYRCCHCNFNLCARCHFLLHPTEFKYLNHRLFHFKSSIKRAECYSCGEISSSPSFICIDTACTYNLHSHCAPFDFPKTTEHKDHGHPLSYMNCSSGTRCFICHDEPQSGYPLYCCKQCDEISHLSCALLEMLPELFANYENSTSEGKTRKLDAELERLRIKEKEKKTELDVISKSIEAAEVARTYIVELHNASQDDQCHKRLIYTLSCLYLLELNIV